jgi:DNA polymerase-3 subunit beta
MNITLNTQQFGKKLKLVEKIIAQKSILPIMSNALLRAEGKEIQLSTTNMEISITTSCAAVVNAPGAITVPVKPLLDVVSQISDEQMHLTLEKGHVRVAAGSFKLRLQTLPIDDFPTLPRMPEGGVLLPGDLFRGMIKKVRSSISDADKRYFMNGALFSLTENAVALIATDGKRLALTTAPRAIPGPKLQIIVPTKTLDVLVSDEGHDDLLFAQGDRQMFFSSEDSILSSRTVDGQFPNYQRIIPRENTHLMTIPRLALVAAIKRVSLTSSETRSIDAIEHLAVTYAGPAFKLAVEWNFVLDFLSAAINQNVTLALKDANTASLWTDGGGDYINVIMLMRAS